MTLSCRHNRCVETLVVVRAVVGHLVTRRRFGPTGDEFLEASLVVVAAGFLGRSIEQVGEEAIDERPGGVQTGVQVNGSDHGLEGVGQNRLLVGPSAGHLAPAQTQGTTEADAAGRLGQCRSAHHRSTDLGQLALWKFRLVTEGAFGDH